MTADDERLALLAIMEKKIKDKLDEEKDKAKDALMDRCAKDGTDRRAVLVGGEKVGEVGVSYAKGHPYITDMPKALDTLRGMGLTVEIPVKNWEDYFAGVAGDVVSKDTGEIVPWAMWEPSRPKGAAVRIKDPQVVLDAFGARLADATLALLEEGVA